MTNATGTPAKGPESGAQPQTDDVVREAQRERQRLLSAAYGAASNRLRQAHQDEFNGYYAEEAKKVGVVWKPRLSPSERAEQQLKELLAQHPELRSKIDEESPDTAASPS